MFIFYRVIQRVFLFRYGCLSVLKNDYSYALYLLKPWVANALKEERAIEIRYRIPLSPF